MARLPMRSQLPPVPQLLLLLLLSAAALCSAQQQCTGKDGQLLGRGHVMPHPEDGCLSEVCRCASEDRCEMVTERRMVLIRVNETKQATVGQPAEILTQMMQCSCVDHLPGSTEMDFLCKSPTQPGRDVGARVIGCLDFQGSLRMPGEKARIRNSRREAMQCDCNSAGHYVNCLPEDDPGDSCLDGVSGQRVPLASTYHRLERNSRGLPIRLRCTCVRSDQETSCTVV